MYENTNFPLFSVLRGNERPCQTGMYCERRACVTNRTCTARRPRTAMRRVLARRATSLRIPHSLLHPPLTASLAKMPAHAIPMPDFHALVAVSASTGTPNASLFMSRDARSHIGPILPTARAVPLRLRAAER